MGLIRKHSSYLLQPYYCTTKETSCTPILSETMAATASLTYQTFCISVTISRLVREINLLNTDHSMMPLRLPSLLCTGYHTHTAGIVCLNQRNVPQSLNAKKKRKRGKLSAPASLFLLKISQSWSYELSSIPLLLLQDLAAETTYALPTWYIMWLGWPLTTNILNEYLEVLW